MGNGDYSPPCTASDDSLDHLTVPFDEECQLGGAHSPQIHPTLSISNQEILAEQTESHELRESIAKHDEQQQSPMGTVRSGGGGGTEIDGVKKIRRIRNEEVVCKIKLDPMIDICFGERLADDHINEYCDKLNASLRNQFDGMLAMQYIALEPQNMKSLIGGRKRVLQILLDQKREHYVLVERLLNDNTIVVFDSLATSKRKAKEALNRRLAEQIYGMFSHLSNDNDVRVRYEIAIEKQTDMWSCGLRTVAFITYRAFDKDPRFYKFNMKKIFKYFCKLLNDKSPTDDKFRHACERFGKWKERELELDEVIFHISRKVGSDLFLDDVAIPSDRGSPENCVEDQKNKSPGKWDGFKEIEQNDEPPDEDSPAGSDKQQLVESQLNGATQSDDAGADYDDNCPRGGGAKKMGSKDDEGPVRNHDPEEE